MPRLGLSISESYDRRPKAPKPDQYGRRVRTVEGVRVVGAREQRPIFTPLYFKVTAALVLLATASISLAMWRLFNFPH